MNSNLKLNLARVIGALLKGIGFSLIMLMVALSALTGEFPPDWNRVKNLQANLAKMEALQSQGPQTPLSNTGAHPEDDVSALEKFYQKRAAIGAGLLGAKTDVSDTAVDVPAATEAPADCSKKIREVEYQLFRLQQRVAELEEQKKN